MSHRGNVIRKALEVFTEAREYHNELLKARDYYQYLRNNVKGVRFDREPTGHGTGETKALAFDKEMAATAADLYRLQMLLDWVNDLMDPLDPEEESIIRERYIEGWTLQEMAERRGTTVDRVRYRIDRIIEEMR